LPSGESTRACLTSGCASETEITRPRGAPARVTAYILSPFNASSVIPSSTRASGAQGVAAPLSFVAGTTNSASGLPSRLWSADRDEVRRLGAGENVRPLALGDVHRPRDPRPKTTRHFWPSRCAPRTCRYARALFRVSLSGASGAARGSACRRRTGCRRASPRSWPSSCRWIRSAPGRSRLR